MNRMKKNKNVKSVSARKLLTVTMLMFYHEHKLSLIVTLVICFSILYIKKIDLDCSLLRNDIVATKGEADIKRKALKLLYIELVGSFLQEFKQYIFANVFGKQIRLVSMKSYKYLLSEKKADKNDGIVQNNINIGNEAMAKLLSVIILNILPCIIGIYFLISKFNAEFKSLFAIAMIGSYFLCAYFHYKIINLKLHHRSKVNQSLGLGNKAIHATILNYESIKTNNMEETEIKKYEQILREYEMNITKYKKYSNILTFIHRAIFSALKYTSYVYYIKNDDVKSFAKISILKTLIENSERNATNLGKIYMKYRNHAICSSLVYPYIKKKPIKFNRYAICDEELKIEFVNYRIEQTNRTVISDFNLAIPYGSKIAIMGKNGSGKSTLVKSILGLNDYEGHIYVNEHNHKHLEIASIRDKIGYVSQNITLFNDSVLYNILYGSKNKSASDAKRIAADINLHDNIKVLEHGYHTTLDEANNTLSGGERQKIIIARALVKDPAILIMDEPFSNLDVQSSKTIFDYIFTKMADKTVIMVLHDSKYLSRFDKVITIN